MSHSERYMEDLPRVAADAYELAGYLCGDCRDLHALWPYARLTRASTGVEQSQSGLEAQLRTFFDLGLRNVLIAGAADSALLAHVARSGARHEIKIVVLDICDTPLELSRRFATQWALPVETVKQDLFNLDLVHRFDVVLMHGTLNFVAADRRAQVLHRLHRAMRPSGRLLLLFNTGRPPAVDQAVESRAEYADFILSELRRFGIPLPDREAAMRERLIARAQEREWRDGQFSAPDQVESLVKVAGFNILSCVPTGAALAKPAGELFAQFSKRRFTLVAEPINDR
jgi:SAM-dependent methyltransferase